MSKVYRIIKSGKLVEMPSHYLQSQVEDTDLLLDSQLREVELIWAEKDYTIAWTAQDDYLVIGRDGRVLGRHETEDGARAHIQDAGDL